MVVRKIVLSYLVFAAIWILSTDVLTHHWVQGGQTRLWIDLSKGWVFVLVTSAVLYGLLQRTLRAQHEIDQRARIASATARDEIERSLRLIEASPSIIYVLRRVEGQFRPVWISGQIVRMLGYSVDEALTADWWVSHLHPEDRDLALAESANLFERGFVTHEYRFAHRDGHYVWIHDELRLIREEGGTEAEIVGAWMDVTGRRLADAAALRWKNAFELSSVGMAIHSAADNTFVQVNNAYARQLGYLPEELEGRRVSMVYEPTERELLTSRLAEIDTLGHLGFESCQLRKDGSLLPVMMGITALRDASGRVVSRFACATDITDEKRLDAELAAYREHLEELVEQRTRELSIAKQAAEVASRAKSDFLATMSHEIRTPMNGVLGLADVLRQSSLSPYQVELVDTMRESALSLLGIIDDILDFSKIEAGRFELVREEVSLLNVIEGVGDTLQPIAARKQVELAVFVDPALPAMISSDALRLRQILTNLVGNAIKFSAGTGRRGKVMLRAELQDGPRLCVTVADNGIGLGEDAIKRLFKPFTQVETTTTRRYGGTGLGLAICKRLVALFEGTIEVSSQPGEGARFTVTLPIQPLPEACADSPPGSGLVGVRCVLVSECASRAADWAAYLAHAGAQVEIRDGLNDARRVISALPEGEGVLVTDTAPADDRWRWLKETFVGRKTGFVIVGRGGRRRPRLQLDNVVSVDGDAMHRAALVEAVAIASGRQAPPVEGLVNASSMSVAPGVPTREEAVAARQLILVAEDDAINRKVIRRQLALLGLACEIAHDGADALQRWRSGCHALVLTDLHMPELDGYQLTAEIRREEAGRPKTTGLPVPIIALTANALHGEAARCKAAGMNDYMSKPVQLDKLREVLEQWLPGFGLDRVAGSGGSAGKEEGGLATLDISVLAGLIGDDPQMIADFLQEFLVSALAGASEIRTAVKGKVWRTVADVAHRLKSSSRSVGALAMGEICADLERAGRTDDAPLIEERMLDFENALAQVVFAIGHHPRRGE